MTLLDLLRIAVVPGLILAAALAAMAWHNRRSHRHGTAPQPTKEPR